jgi:Holliday junction resolvase
MNNKELEAKAVQFLISKLSSDGYECVDLRSDRSKGWDLEAIKDGVTYPIEVKSTRAIKRKFCIQAQCAEQPDTGRCNMHAYR